jgi:phosphoribosylamine-glycine ligase
MLRRFPVAAADTTGEQAGLTVVGPEDPLAAGVAETPSARGTGQPRRAAARRSMASSKASPGEA